MSERAAATPTLDAWKRRMELKSNTFWLPVRRASMVLNGPTSSGMVKPGIGTLIASVTPSAARLMVWLR